MPIRMAVEMETSNVFIRDLSVDANMSGVEMNHEMFSSGTICTCKYGWGGDEP